MSLSDTLKKLIVAPPKPNKSQRRGYKRDSVFLPGISEQEYMNATRESVDIGANEPFAGLMKAANAKSHEAKALQAYLPALRKAHSRGDIFAFNNVMSRYNKRATGKTALEAPDAVDLRKNSRRRQDRTIGTGRASTMLSLGPRF